MIKATSLVEIIQDMQIKEVKKQNPGEHFISGTHSHGHDLDIDNCVVY